MIKTNDFSLIIPRDVMDKINWWMHKTNKEVSGFGSLEFDEITKTFKIKDAILLKQKVGSASAEIDSEALAKAMYEMREEPMGLKWHWHSHVNMGVFWSQDDRDLISSLGSRDWILATVFNYKEERRTAFMTTSKVMGCDHDLFIDNIPTSVTNYIQAELYEEWDKEYADKVSDVIYGTGGHDYLIVGPGQGIEGPLRYSVYGYAKSNCNVAGQGWIYNPLHDTGLVNETEQMNAIENMCTEEINYLLSIDTKFNELWIKSISRPYNGGSEHGY